MKIYGIGLLLAPGTNRVVHDFTDGCYDTVNPVLLEAAKKQGFSFEPLVNKTDEVVPEKIEVHEVDIEPIKTRKKRSPNKRGTK